VKNTFGREVTFFIAKHHRLTLLNFKCNIRRNRERKSSPNFDFYFLKSEDFYVHFSSFSHGIDKQLLVDFLSYFSLYCLPQ